MERSRQLGLPMPFDCQPVIAEAPPFIPNYQRVLFDYKLGWHSNEIEWVEVKNKVTAFPAPGSAVLEEQRHDLSVSQLHPDNNTKAPEVEAVCAAPVEVLNSPDYSKQLQFHEYELSQAEKRQMPASQVAYHFDRLCLLRKMGVEYE